MSRLRGGLWKRYIAVQIYGANTDVGKTVFSTLLGLGFKNGLMKQPWKFKIQYIKPVSTGPANDRDDRSVRFSDSVVKADLS
jgi:dethiobiotin synthetase/adenosylmethionine--8-amino-7-oxononanoate aminotransferase